jgi:hypothetical protein
MQCSNTSTCESFSLRAPDGSTPPSVASYVNVVVVAEPGAAALEPDGEDAGSDARAPAPLGVEKDARTLSRLTSCT